jgi:hypothetical protein
MTRQQRWAEKQRAAGKCRACGRKRTHYATLCDVCQVASNKARRARSGGKAWRKGTVGRPPLVIPAKVAGRKR